MTITKERIKLLDAMRGFALVAIILLHSIEHFNLFGKNTLNPEWLEHYDKIISKNLYLLFSGKAYAMFSLLLGYNFYMQYSKHLKEGYDFGLRYLWRLFLLLIIGVFHAAFYEGDILILYAITGFVVVITRKWNNIAILLFAIVLLSEPLGLSRIIQLNLNPDFKVNGLKFYASHKQVVPFMEGASLFDLLMANLKYGIEANYAWNWEYGRVSQTPGLFLMGVLACRQNFFTKTKLKTWFIILGTSLVAFIVLINTKEILLEGYTKPLSVHIGRVMDGYTNLVGTVMLIAIFIVTWNALKGEKWMHFFTYYGCMSLTNYVFQGIIGVIVFQGVGLGLYKYCGATLSVCLGLTIFLLQLAFSSWYLKHNKYGPLESLWRKATWIKSNKINA